MMKNIFGSIKNVFHKKGSIDPKMIDKISKMNLSDMRLYVKNGMKDFELSAIGLNEVLKKLVTPLNEKGELYLKADDTDSKKKKAFELVLLAAGSIKISVTAIELMQQFVETYRDIINDYDDEQKDIYHSRLIKAIETAIENVYKINSIEKTLDLR
ncbi:hypothetical protein [Sulfurimonas sp. C5]|uniref:hypothetical protein n=1 Tax=Sulfurimonas sp. C5 TaxID=3036947 RepID=UPI002457AEBF|nr:hypothetical protein [Sulfurimonas sp. C5]MDH4944873.1 hypothetical protein [Sulfurimonas sp. C5]